MNAYNQNIVGSKENGNSDIYVTLGVENSFPLIKIDKNKEQTITPKIFTKYTTGTMADARNTIKYYLMTTYIQWTEWTTF